MTDTGSQQGGSAAATQQMLQALKEARTRLEAAERAKSEPIAVIGLGCRFPGGATDADGFWSLLQNGVDAVIEVPQDRWNIDDYYDPDPDVPGKMYTRYGGFLQEPIDQFDPQFFGISPREAVSMDPQQRLLLEVSWAALEHAGLAADQLRRSRTGVFMGLCWDDYAERVREAVSANAADLYAGFGILRSVAVGRISYVLGLQGPNIQIDTACSSSLVAVHLACQSLRAQECDMALAGGVNLLISPLTTLGRCQSKTLALDGRCKTFDAAADGYGQGEGCGVVVLKRLSDAQRDGDPILALVRGSAINHDGPSSGLTVPNEQAQEDLIRQALKNGRVKPEQIHYIEAHGTGTSLGDPIEVGALDAVFGASHSQASPLLIGSVKTNLGHLEGAAGIACFIKLVLALQREEIPPHLHFHTPNPHIDWDHLPMRVTTERTPWPRGEHPRLAGVSSFGISGTNAHLVLEEAPLQAPIHNPPERSHQLLTLSARSEAALKKLAGAYRQYLVTHPETPLADLCFTANTGRSLFPKRLGMVAASTSQMLEQLQAITQGEPEIEGVVRGQATGQRLRVAMLFTGQGSQYVGMGRELYATQPAFKKSLDRCAQILDAYLDQPFLKVLFSSEGVSPIDQTGYTQPALFALEYSLAQVWMSWGIQPAILMGHSVGEYVAACLAGVFSLEDGLKLIAHRARLMQSLSSDGAMVSALTDPDTVQAAIAGYPDRVSIAAYNGPESVVFSGERQAVEAVARDLETQGIKVKPLEVSQAFHSPLMDPMLQEFEAIARQVKFASPRIPIISNVSGDLASQEIATPEYWVNHVRQPVKFAQGMQALQQQGVGIYLEVGPKPILLGMGRQCLAEEQGIWLPSLRHDQPDGSQLLKSLAHLYIQGIKIDWKSVESGYTRCKISGLPTYPFERQRYWLNLPTQTHRPSVKDPHPSELHPLLGQQLRTPLQDQVFETYLSPSQPAYLQDHCVFQRIIVPGAAYIEMALAAGRHLLKTTLLQLEDVIIQQALQLQPTSQRLVQVILSPHANGSYQFKIFSENQDQENEPVWIEHASGYVKAAASEPRTITLHHLQDQCPETLSVLDYYAQLQANGLEYGPLFQGIQQLRCSQTQALGQIQLPEVLRSRATDYLLHPVLLDASMQTMGAAFQQLAGSALGQAYMPVGYESLVIYRPAGSGLWAQVEEVQARGQQGETLHARLNLWDEAGDLVARLVVAVRRVSRQQLQRSLQPDLSGWLYQQEWKAAISTPLADHTSAQGHWLIFADQGGVGEKLAGHLQAAGGRCTLVHKNQEETFSQASDHFRLNPLDPEHYQYLLQVLPPSDLYRGVIHLWSLDEKLSDWDAGEDILASQHRTCGSLIFWLQALASVAWPTPPRLWILTQGAQSLDLDSAPLQLKQAPLWGFARVLALEHPDLQSVRMDLDPASVDLSLLLSDLLQPDFEDQIAYREGQRFVARLVRYAPTAAQKSTDLPVYPYRLSLPSYGVLDHLQLVAFTPTPPAPGEVQIQVRATGLNFRDVLTALGMMQEVLEQMGIKSAAEVPFGGECAGVITAIGEGVTDLQVGDEVIAAQTLGSFASYVNVPADFVAAKPQTLSFAEAATLPVTFLTAYYGLVKCAQLQPGERVLVHAAAGGVGQAAVQIAQWIGAEVMGTASPGKWELLRSQGVEQIFNSRTLDYGEEILTATGGEGVEVILNSLTGDYIPTNLKVLKQGGRFVEIGKLGIWSQEQMQAERPDVTYFPFDLLEVSNQDPHILQEMLRELMVCFREGQLRPLPHQTFPIQEVGDAFRVMAQAKHVGKVVVTHPAPDQPQERPVVRQDGAYLITGGLGALGLQVAKWLAEQGAQHLILTGRQAPSERAAKLIQHLQETGTQVQVVAADISRREDVQGLIHTIQTQGIALRGIMHAAGVLDDGVLTQQTWERFEKVMAPKVAGTWHLHQLTQDQPLDWFVCFSSMASLIGSPGQGNYAAANAFMDALAHYRQSHGLTATSINWGPWAEAGMAASLSQRDQDRLKEQGIRPIQTSEGIPLLEELLRQNVTQVGVLPIQWSKLAQQSTLSSGSTFFEAFLSSVSAAAAPTEAPQDVPAWRIRLEAAQPEERSDLLATFIEEQVQKVLGMGQGQALDPDRSFAEMGMDSLMAVELRNRLQISLGSSIPSTVAFDYPTTADLAEFLAQDILKLTSEDTADSASGAETGSEMDSTLAELSQDEIARLLAQELGTIEESVDHE